jgi:hypothetical protein
MQLLLVLVVRAMITVKEVQIQFLVQLHLLVVEVVLKIQLPQHQEVLAVVVVVLQEVLLLEQVIHHP